MTKMRFFHIITSGMTGDSYYASNFHPDRPLSDRAQCRTWFVMEIDSDSLPFPFFSNHWNHFFVKDELKNVMENGGFKEIQFEKITKLIIGPNLEFNNPNHGFSENSFWKLNFIGNNKEMMDFLLWKDTYLVVSEKALDFLYKQNAFEDDNPGKYFGPEFEMVMNKFEIYGSIENFFNNELPLILSKKEAMWNRIHDEYRRREGLPPLVR